MAILQETSGTKVYYVTGGTKAHIPNPQAGFDRFGAEYPTMIQRAASGVLEGLRTVSWKNGSSGSSSGSSSKKSSSSSKASSTAKLSEGIYQEKGGTKVYYVTDGTKAHIPNPDAGFDRFGPEYATMIRTASRAQLDPFRTVSWSKHEKPEAQTSPPKSSSGSGSRSKWGSTPPTSRSKIYSIWRNGEIPTVGELRDHYGISSSKARTFRQTIGSTIVQKDPAASAQVVAAQGVWSISDDGWIQTPEKVWVNPKSGGVSTRDPDKGPPGSSGNPKQLVDGELVDAPATDPGDWTLVDTPGGGGSGGSSSSNGSSSSSSAPLSPEDSLPVAIDPPDEDEPAADTSSNVSESEPMNTNQRSSFWTGDIFGVPIDIGGTIRYGNQAVPGQTWMWGILILVVVFLVARR